MKNWAKLANNVFTNLVCQCAQTDLAYPPFQIRARAWSAYLRISRDSLTARAYAWFVACIKQVIVYRSRGQKYYKKHNLIHALCKLYNNN